MTAAQEAATEAITRAGDHASPAWLAAARTAVANVSSGGREFTADAVWAWLADVGAPAPPEPRALGAVMRQMATAGVIVKTDRVRPSVRVENHARPVAIWRGVRPQAVGNPGDRPLF